jgi:alginate O-acetyltransferase complex protein AlgI
MLFNSYVFFLFLGTVLPISYALGKRNKQLFLLLSSYVFYGYWDYRFCALLIISTLVDFNIGARLGRSNNSTERRRYLLISLFTNLGILGYFKYANFFIDSFQAVASSMGLTLDALHLNIILPVGISFYTFQTLSYTIDIYRRRLEPSRDLVEFALFVSFFPQLVAGPIERASKLLPQISELHNPKWEEIKTGVSLIIVGLFKKVMIGDTAGKIADQLFASPQHFTGPELLAALILFSVQIYADFSGYSRIARGTAKLLGVDLMKNFEQPYLSANITEFWRRWHISLSTWLRDYLYISLGGNRISPLRTRINLMLTMLLGGLWHGASWNFVIWGGLHGLYLWIHKLILKDRRPSDRFIYRSPLHTIGYLIQILTTYVLVLFTWLFFRVATFEETVLILEKMIAWEQTPQFWWLLRSAGVFLGTVLILDTVEYRKQQHDVAALIPQAGLRWGFLATLFAATLLYMFQAAPAPFIYFQF